MTCCGTTCCAGYCCDGVCQEESCGSGCESDADCDLWYVEAEGGGDTDDGHARGGPFWGLGEAQADLAAKKANPVSDPNHCGTGVPCCTCGLVTGPSAYCCDGVCQEEECPP